MRAVLAQRFDPGALIAGDAFFQMVDRGYIDPRTDAAHRQNKVVVTAAAAAAGRMTQGGYTVVFEGVIGPWFLETFLAATGLREVHCVMLLPPEQVCLVQVTSRAGHGFTDPAAARHMYQEFAGAATSQTGVVTPIGTRELVATTIIDLIDGGSLRMPVDHN